MVLWLQKSNLIFFQIITFFAWNLNIKLLHSQSWSMIIYTRTPQEERPTLTEGRDMYQQHSELHPTPSLHQFSSVISVHKSKVIVKVLENRQYRLTVLGHKVFFHFQPKYLPISIEHLLIKVNNGSKFLEYKFTRRTLLVSRWFLNLIS